jgi:hypothetical protein
MFIAAVLALLPLSAGAQDAVELDRVEQVLLILDYRTYKILNS